MPSYMPAEMVHSPMTSSEVETVLGELSEYSFNEPLLQLPRFDARGRIRLSPQVLATLGVWVSQAAAHDLEHGADIVPVAVFNAVPRERGVNLEAAQTRAQMVREVERVLGLGIRRINLDVEPYPTGPGYLRLLEELDAALAAHGSPGGLSVVAPADTATWGPAYTRRVGELVGEYDPTFYDSEIATAAGYEEWIEGGLATLSAELPATTPLVPVIPSYGPNPWHNPSVEDIAHASQALRVALAQGSRVSGAGLWWWYGFYEEEQRRRYRSAEDRAAWLAQTLTLPFSG